MSTSSYRCAAEPCNEYFFAGHVMQPSPFHLCSVHMKQWVADERVWNLAVKQGIMERQDLQYLAILRGPMATADVASRYITLQTEILTILRQRQLQQLRWLANVAYRDEER